MLVVGAGGLGSPVLYYLAAAGVGRLGVADADTVAVSNLHRQILYTTPDVGRAKVDVAAERLRALNPDVTVVAHPVRVDGANIDALIAGYDVVVDAPDNFATRYLVNDACWRAGKPLVEAAVLGFSGMLMTIVPPKTPCYRCLYPNPAEGRRRAFERRGRDHGHGAGRHRLAAGARGGEGAARHRLHAGRPGAVLRRARAGFEEMRLEPEPGLPGVREGRRGAARRG